MNLSWELAYPLGTLLLFLVLAFGFWRYMHRSRREKQISEAAAHEMHKHPEAYEHGGRQALEDEAEREQARQENKH